MTTNRGDAGSADALRQLIATWREQARKSRRFDAPLGGKAIGRGIAGVFDNCADELEAVLRDAAARLEGATVKEGHVSEITDVPTLRRIIYERNNEVAELMRMVDDFRGVTDQ